MLVFCTACKEQNKAQLEKTDARLEDKGVITSQGPKIIIRNLIQDRKGNIWIAAFDGIFRYNGKSFTNITGKVSSARFFSVLEDRKGNLWFGSIGAGVYCYDGRSFVNFTTKDGLAGNEVGCIYEDKAGNIWFGTGHGVSYYDGRKFRNLTTNNGLPNNNVNSIIEDKTGKFWFGTGGDACVYDGKTFIIPAHEGKPFTNVRTIIEDKQGDIWLGGGNGLWRYDGNTFTNFRKKFVGCIFEDKKGNILISSVTDGEVWARSAFDGRSLSAKTWAVYRYDGKSLSDKKPTVKEIKSEKAMICGILEANDGSIWYGAMDGVHRLDGNALK